MRSPAARPARMQVRPMVRRPAATATAATRSAAVVQAAPPSTKQVQLQPTFARISPAQLCCHPPQLLSPTARPARLQVRPTTECRPALVDAPATPRLVVRCAGAGSYSTNKTGVMAKVSH